MNSGSQGLSFHQDMALMQMCAGKEEIFSLPMWKEKLTTVKNTPSKGENRQAKRKLYSSGSEDEDKKAATLKKRRNSPVGDLSPSTGQHVKPRTPNSAQRVTTVPLSERQQMALLMRQITDETHHDPIPHCGPPNSPFSSANKKTPSSDCKSYKRNSRGETPLHTAAIKGDIKTVKKLIETGIDVNIKDYAGWTALHEACNFGRVDVAKCLLKGGANVNVQGLDNDLPLHDAARNNHVKIVELLLRHGADPLLQNLKGKSSLDVATKEEIIKLMNSEVMASGSSCSSMSLPDMRSPASLESFPTEQDEERSHNKKDAVFVVDNKHRQSMNHKIRESSLPDGHPLHIANQQIYRLVMPRSSSTLTQLQDLSQWNVSLNHPKKTFNVAGYPEKSCLLAQNHYFNPIDDQLKDHLLLNNLYGDGRGKLNMKNTTTSNSIKDIGNIPAIGLDVNFLKSVPPAQPSPPNVSTIKSENLTPTSQPSESSKPFVTQFEDISDAEDDDMKATCDDPKLKSNFLVGNLQHIIPPNMSSNLYRPNAPLYFSTSMPSCSTVSQFSLLQNFQWPMGYGCFPVIANAASATQLLSTNITLPPTSHCHPGLPNAAVWRCLSPNKNISSHPLETSLQKTSPVKTENIKVEPMQDVHQTASPSKEESYKMPSSDMKMPEALVRSPSLVTDPSWQSPSKTTPSATIKKESIQETPLQPLVTVPDPKVMLDMPDLHNPPIVPPPAPSPALQDLDKQASEQLLADNISISLNVPRSIDIVASDLALSSQASAVCLANKNVLFNTATSTETPDLSKIATENTSRVSSPSDSLDGFSNFPKVPPIKIVLSSKNSEAASEKSTPVHRSIHPYVVGASTPDDVISAECQINSAQSSVVPPIKDGVDNASTSSSSSSTSSSSVVPKTEPQNSHPELLDVAPAKKRKTKHGCRVQTPIKDVEIERDTDSTTLKTGKDSSSTSTPQNSDDVREEMTSSRHTTERRVTRSTTASKQQQRPAKDQRNHQEAVTINGRNDSNNAPLKQESADHNSSCKEDEETLAGHSIGRKAKVKGQRAPNDMSGSSDSAVPVPPPQIFKKPTNPYEAYLNFKKKVADRRSRLSTIYPKPPPKFSEYLMMKGTYRLDPNADAGSGEPVAMLPAPASLPDTLKKLFDEQEKSRNDLKQHHHKERDRLVLTAEQETLRIHGKAARAMANEGHVLSACAILCSESPCYPLKMEHDENKDSRSRYSGRHFHGWLQEIVEKYSRLKMELLARHRHEATILHGMQKLSWEWKMKELGLCDCHSTPFIETSHVPLVVIDDRINFNIT